MQPIIDQLRRQLKAAGPQRWPAISASTGLPESFLRKLAYGDRKNPGLRRVESLRQYFAKDPSPALAVPAASAASH